jgi:uncharacterized protein (TIGR00730 family)
MGLNHLGMNEEEMLEKIKYTIDTLDTPYQKLGKDMIVDLLKLISESGDFHDLNLVQTTLNELRHAFKVFLPYRDVRKVCIFGSARTPETDPNYQIAEEFASKITKIGYMVITGAGPGIMEAGNRGAEGDMSFGVNIKLPFEQQANPFILESPKLVSFKYFFNRKVVFLKESDATVLFPGGFGTHDEGFEVLTLIQTGRCAPRPLIMMSAPNDSYWTRWREFIQRELCDKHYISPDDMSLLSFPETADEAVHEITKFYKTYHSIRYFHDLAVIRLNHPLHSATMKAINNTFSDLVTSGSFEMCDPDQFMLDHGNYSDKYRLVFKFNKVTYGRLNALIRFINDVENQ